MKKSSATSNVLFIILSKMNVFLQKWMPPAFRKIPSVKKNSNNIYFSLQVQSNKNALFFKHLAHYISLPGIYIHNGLKMEKLCNI